MSPEQMSEPRDEQRIASAADRAGEIAAARLLLIPGPDDEYSAYIENPTDAQREAAKLVAEQHDLNAKNASIFSRDREAEVQAQIAQSYRNIASR